MSDTKQGGGPAFPAPRHPATEDWKEGMSLRDWFAGQALAGIMVDPGAPPVHITAKIAYECADAMLKAREQQ